MNDKVGNLFPHAFVDTLLFIFFILTGAKLHLIFWSSLLLLFRVLLMYRVTKEIVEVITTKVRGFFVSITEQQSNSLSHASDYPRDNKIATLLNESAKSFHWNYDIESQFCTKGLLTDTVTMA